MGFGHLQNCKAPFAPDIFLANLSAEYPQKSGLERVSQQNWFDTFAVDTLPCTSKTSECKLADSKFAATPGCSWYLEQVHHGLADIISQARAVQQLLAQIHGLPQISLPDHGIPHSHHLL